MFNETFKYYKSKQKPPDLSEVFDFDAKIETCQKVNISNTCQQQHFAGVQSPTTWTVLTLPSNPGLIFIRNPFTARGQRYWIARCLRDYPKHPHAVNLSNIKTIPADAITDWWQCLQNTKAEKERMKLKTDMRWATLGYHHDWDSKVYSDNFKHNFPVDLSDLMSYFANVLGFASPYRAQAAIVNFYPFGTTLSGHTDHSEKNLNAPLFSISFGQTAIFLLGGTTRDVKPTAMFLKSGDIVIMSKESRLCYHAVPRIIKAGTEPWNNFHNESEKTINNNENGNNNECDSSNRKKRKLDESTLDLDLWHSIDNGNEYWNDYQEYIKDCRININVRQVLSEGETTL